MFLNPIFTGGGGSKPQLVILHLLKKIFRQPPHEDPWLFINFIVDSPAEIKILKKLFLSPSYFTFCAIFRGGMTPHNPLITPSPPKITSVIKDNPDYSFIK